MGKILGFGSIDCTKITKSKMVNNKDGKPAYVNIVIWENDQPDKYGNMYSITESQTKEEREKGEKAVYLGNIKPSVKQQNTTVASDINPDNGQDLPF